MFSVNDQDEPQNVASADESWVPSGTPEEQGDSEYIDFITTETPSGVLRLLLRQHIVWLFASGGLAAAAFLFPSTPWYLGGLRFILFVLAFVIGIPRLFQINGIVGEFRSRQNKTSTNQVDDETTDNE